MAQVLTTEQPMAVTLETQGAETDRPAITNRNLEIIEEVNEKGIQYKHKDEQFQTKDNYGTNEPLQLKQKVKQVENEMIEQTVMQKQDVNIYSNQEDDGPEEIV